MNIDNWINEVDQHAHPNIPIIVIANKCDLLEKSMEIDKFTTENSEDNKENINNPGAKDLEGKAGEGDD